MNKIISFILIIISLNLSTGCMSLSRLTFNAKYPEQILPLALDASGDILLGTCIGGGIANSEFVNNRMTWNEKYSSSIGISTLIILVVDIAIYIFQRLLFKKNNNHKLNGNNIEDNVQGCTKNICLQTIYS